MNRRLFYTVSEMKAIYHAASDYEVVIWGTGEPAKTAYATLEAAGIKVLCFGDNNTAMQGTRMLGLEIRGQGQIKKMNKPMVIIACWITFRPILESLINNGIYEVYALTDPVKYNYHDMILERNQLSDFFCSGNSRSEKILLEIYGNIGDVILRTGIIFYFLQRYGHDNLYVLVESVGVADVIKLLVPNVVTLDNKRFSADKQYRLQLLHYLNKKYFKRSYILADIRIHSTRRCLNTYNFNVQDVLYSNMLPDREYLPEMDGKLVKQYENLPEDYLLSPVNILNRNLSTIKFPYALPDKYAAIHMGASNSTRHYAVDKMKLVIEFILKSGFSVVILGQGEYDENYSSALLKLFPKENLVSMVSKLSLPESMYVIMQSAFFVGTDSGMWNASYILDKESVVIYGKGEIGNFQHTSRKVHYAMSELLCEGCRWFCTNKSERGYASCIDSIAPELIIEKIQEIRGLKKK